MSGWWRAVRIGVRIQRTDVASPMVMTVLPLALIPFFLPGARAQLVAEGFTSASGAEQAVPGLAALFAFLTVQQVVTTFGNEHAWGTWTRLRAAPIRLGALLAGRSAVLFIVQLAQLTVVCLGGAWWFSYHPNGSWWGIAAVLVSLAFTLVAFGLLLVAAFRSTQQALVAASVGGMVMAAGGGALAPVSTFPGWAAQLAPASPAYWALQPLRHLSLEGATLAQVLPSVGVLVLFGLGFSGIALALFRPAAEKIR